MRGRHKDARPGAARRLDVKQVALRGQVFWGVFEDQSRQIGRLREDRRSALDDLEREREVHATRARPCLCCGVTIQSEGPHHRMCPSCRQLSQPGAV
ncbi:MAG: hypothetical protein KDA73_10510 [Rhodobacteraceae bacterium]|nr:hypothetical protein [Paracoccaceae bacterium]